MCHACRHVVLHRGVYAVPHYPSNNPTAFRMLAQPEWKGGSEEGLPAHPTVELRDYDIVTLFHQATVRDRLPDNF